MMGNLPTNWESWRLGDVGTWYGGGTPASAEAAYWDGDIPWVSPKDMKSLRLTTSIDKITPEAVENSATKLIPTGAVLFVTRSGILAHSFPVAVSDVAVTVNQDLKAIKPVEVIDPEYIAWALRAAERKILSSCSKHGTTVHSIEMPSLKDLPVAIPPLNEQRRIIAKIEELFSELDKGVESLSTARGQLTAYRHSVLKAAFEGRLTDKWRRRQKTPATANAIVAEALAEKTRGGRVPPRHDNVVQPAVPDAWGTVALGDLSVDVFDGPFGSNLKTSDYVDAGVRVIRLENIGYGKFIEEKCSYISMEKYEGLKRHTIVPGDIVVSSFVTDALRSAIVPASVPVSINKADCFAVRFRGQTMTAEFAQRFFESRCAFKQMEGMIHGVGRPRINTTQLKQLVLPICSRAEQIEVLSAISAAYSEIDALEAELSAQMQKATALRQSILKRAFSGQLVAQDAADEPASVLLGRIRNAQEQGASTKRRNIKNNKKEAA